MNNIEYGTGRQTNLSVRQVYADSKSEKIGALIGSSRKSSCMLFLQTLSNRQDNIDRGLTRRSPPGIAAVLPLGLFYSFP